MFTIKQIEAFFWVARLGTLQRAADTLHITQSAVTKRLQELQAHCAAPLLDAAAKRSTLTPKGREVMVECERLLEGLGRLEQLQQAIPNVARVVRIGVTDLVALTWFPTFLRQMRQAYPDVTFRPDIDLSVTLRDKVLDGRLDFIIVPEPALPASMSRVELGRARFSWFGPPGSFARGRVVPLRELAALPVIEQTTNSVITAVSSRMFASVGVDPVRLEGGNNLIALCGLIEAGVGISCLPVSLFKRQVSEGLLQRIETDPPAPDVSYVAAFLKHPRSTFGFACADVARRCCDFGDTNRSRRQGSAAALARP